VSLTPEQRSQRARLAAYAQHAAHDTRATTAKARETFLKSFEDKVDPDRTLPEAERLRRAQAARKAHFTALAYQSSRARSARTDT
jgi:hypothetical protein